MLCRQILNYLQNLPRQLRIQCRGRFIKKQHLRFHRQCPCDRYSLLLPSGELIRICIRLIRKSHLCKELLRLLIDFFFLSLLHTDRCICNIFDDGKMRKQIKVLEYQTKAGLNLFHLLLFRKSGSSIFHPCRSFSQIQNLTVINRLQHRRTAEQRRLAGTGRADDRQNLSLLHRKRNIPDHRHPAEFFFDMFHFQKTHSGNLLMIIIQLFFK